ncbi:MAG: diaminopimelate decarboxylase, partial [Gammaproteobacteria bacterium]
MSRKQKLVKRFVEHAIIDRNLTAIGIMDFAGLEDTISSLKAAFPDNFSHTFAVKANPLIKVLEYIASTGVGAEVASPGELMAALEAGFHTENIVYDSPTKTTADLQSCIKNNISINIDNVQELQRIDQLMLQFPTSKSVIGFRINTQVGSGKILSTSTATATSKFGYALNDANNRQALLEIYKKRPWLTSLHSHSGSQGCSLELMIKGLHSIAELAEQINHHIGEQQQIKRIDIGGGLPVNFLSEKVTPTFKEFSDKLSAAVSILFEDKYQVKTEFGRSIVTKNGVILTRVEYTKQTGGRHIALTHAGAQVVNRTTLLPELWPLRVSCFSPNGEEKTAAANEVVATDIGGPCCFAGDLICSNQQLPKLLPDDYVLIHDTGGYNFSSHYQ